jgi:hypothetical protein
MTLIHNKNVYFSMLREIIHMPVLTVRSGDVHQVTLKFVVSDDFGSLSM